MFTFKRICLLVVLLGALPAAAAATAWQELPSAQARSAAPPARLYQVDNGALRAELQRVTEWIGPGSQKTIRLPMPDGGTAEYEIYESPVMDDELARKYPEIRTFQVYGIDDPAASGRLDITPAGFHAMLYTSQGRLFIDPERGQPDRYRARTRDAAAPGGYACAVDEMGFTRRAVPGEQQTASKTAARSSNKLLKYKIAVSATEEYVDKIYSGSGSRRDQALAEIVMAINRVNEIYQRDLGIFLRLVAGNDELIELNGEAGFDNSIPSNLLSQNQLWIDTVLGNNKYDVGHVFSTSGGGVAFLGSACDDARKARGVSGIGNPVGDPFYIDFVAHEIGHQFNADHTFNGKTSSCRGSRHGSTAFEPGSGSTIMAYAGICGVEDIQMNSDATFHAGSIRQIERFTSSAAGACYATKNISPANPNHPKVNSLANKSIPANTAFVLEAVASDADGDTLLYQWDQMDAGCATDAVSFGTDNGSNALFRSYNPSADQAARHFPALGTQLQGLYDDAEVLPCQDRDLNFRVTVRDGKSGLDTANIKLAVKKTNGRFRITGLNTPGPVDLNTPGQMIVNPAPISVEWNVARTDKSPINCANVDIELMTFAPGYATYSLYPLAMTTLNDGTESVAIAPSTDSHPRARIRVKCSDNVFYDISDADFEIKGTGAGSFIDTLITTYFNNNGTTGNFAPSCNRNVTCGKSTVAPTGGSGGGGSSAFDFRWLLAMSALLVLSGLRRRDVRTGA